MKHSLAIEKIKSIRDKLEKEIKELEPAVPFSKLTTLDQLNDVIEILVIHDRIIEGY